MKPVKEHQTHMWVSKKRGRCRGKWGKWGKLFMNICMLHNREKGRPVGEITEENKEISEGSRKNNVRENLKEMGLFSLQQKYRRKMITIL